MTSSNCPDPESNRGYNMFGILIFFPFFCQLLKSTVGILNKKNKKSSHF
nr:MAG TPA: hypothetical protein [Bacteriophage sp.]